MHILQERILANLELLNNPTYSIRKISAELGAGHPQKIKHHLEQLIKKGIVGERAKGEYFIKEQRYDKNSPSQEIHLIEFPIYGSANCGPATFFADNQAQGHLQISENLLNNQVLRNLNAIYALRAIGNSMNDAKIPSAKESETLPIKSGDYVLVDHTNTNPDSGDYVVSVINGAANIKKFTFQPSHGIVMLLSESLENQDPIVLKDDDSYRVTAKVVQVIPTAY